MASVRIGYRRLYDSMGCSIANQQALNVVFPFGEKLQAEIYMGNKPKFGITVETNHEDYFIPGTQTSFGEYSYHSDATQSSYPRTFFTEIICSQIEEVSDELFEAFYRDEPAAYQELLSRAETYTDEYYMVADLLSGIVGLRFHPQFIIKLLNEIFIAFHHEKYAFNHAGSSVQMLETVQLNQSGINTIHQFFPETGKVETKVAQKNSRNLAWLIRAWAEKDTISKFNALFIPLEMILDGVQGVMPQDQQEQVEKLYNLINTHGGEGKETLVKLLDRLVKSQRPSLIDRFNIFAERAKMSGWKKDIQAFKKFNTIRNSLIHRGDPNVKIYVKIGESDLFALEDLTERYVNYYLFHDASVYQSHFLPRPKPSTE